ncbi:MAG: thiamine-phosphate kinase [Candidatus Binatia bacterium]
MMKLRDLGEFPFLRRLRERVPTDPRVLLSLGDDCAALSLPGTILLTTDALVENVHFRREWTTFATLGEKAFAVNASDIAAMGGEPTFALLSLGVPQECEVADLDAFFDGFLRAATANGAALIGGNMSTAPCLMLSVTLLGHAPHGIVTRAGARVGNDLYVTGTLGDAALGLHLLQEGRNDLEAQSVKARFLCPTIRLAVARELAAGRLASAMIDVSDGLLQDLGHLCEESCVGAVVETTALPLSGGYRALLGEDRSLALSGGEDYELLFSAPVEHRAAVNALAQNNGCAITRIGSLVPPAEGISVRGSDGTVYAPASIGFDHFHC